MLKSRKIKKARIGLYVNKSFVVNQADTPNKNVYLRWNCVRRNIIFRKQRKMDLAICKWEGMVFFWPLFHRDNNQSQAPFSFACQFALWWQWPYLSDSSSFSFWQSKAFLFQSFQKKGNTVLSRKLFAIEIFINIHFVIWNVYCSNTLTLIS